MVAVRRGLRRRRGGRWFDQLIQGLPVALRPVYTTDKINAPITLYRGQLELRRGSEAMGGRGRCTLRWLPFPSLDFELPAWKWGGWIGPDEKPGVVRLVDKRATSEARVSRVVLGAPLRRKQAAGLAGELRMVRIGRGSRLRSVLFHEL